MRNQLKKKDKSQKCSYCRLKISDRVAYIETIPVHSKCFNKIKEGNLLISSDNTHKPKHLYRD